MAKKPTAQRPFKPEPLRGSTLAQMWLDGKTGELHKAEWKLLEACRRGEDCVVDDAERDEDGNGAVVRPESLTEQNHVRAGFLRYLILGGCKDAPIHARGMRLGGAYISCDVGASGKKELDLESANITHDFALFGCNIDGDVNVRGATAQSIFLSGSAVKSVEADRLETKGGVNLREGFVAEGEVRFGSAKLGGDLDCTDGGFKGAEIALSCDGLKTKGSVFLREGFVAVGKVRFPGANIQGQVTLRDAKLESGLICHDITMNSGVLLDSDCTINGEVNFRNATIKGDLNCQGGKFLCKDKSLTARRAVISGDVNFNEAECLGSISLNGAEIGGSVSFNNTALKGAPSLQMQNAKIGGTLFWRELSRIKGEVMFGGTDCKTMSFDRKSWFREFEKDRKNNKRKNPKPDNNAGKMPVKNGEDAKPKRPFTKLDNFTYLGFNDLEKGADAQFWIDWLKVQPDENLGSRFRPKPWSQLAGVLDSMGYEAEAKAVRIEREKLLTQFMEKHDPEDSRAGFISPNFWRVWWRKHVWGRLTDYGYNPLKAISFLAGLIALGAFVFWGAALYGIMAPTHPLIYKEVGSARVIGSIDPICRENWVYFKAEKCKAQMPSEYSEFSALMYSADMAIPIINLRQEDDWSPRVVDTRGARIWSGYAVRIYEWFQILAGWLLSLLVVSAVGGSVRR